MAMLECYTPSLIGWRILEKTAVAFMTVSENEAKEAMRALAFPNAGDPAIVAGESGARALPAFSRSHATKALAERLWLGKDSHSHHQYRNGNRSFIL